MSKKRHTAEQIFEGMGFFTEFCRFFRGDGLSQYVQATTNVGGKTDDHLPNEARVTHEFCK